MGSKWHIFVDRSLCIGSGVCAATAINRFELDAKHRSVACDEVIDADPEVLEAARSCPVEAIFITELDTERQLFPEE